LNEDLHLEKGKVECVDFKKGDLLLREYGINIWSNRVPLNHCKSESSWSSFVEDENNEINNS
jgi:hypothetical protein